MEYDDTPIIPFNLEEDDFLARFEQYPNIEKLLIIDDINYRNLKTKIKNNLQKLITYTSTHCNLSICFTCQDITYLPCELRRNVNIMILYNPNDRRTLMTMFNRVSHKLTKSEFIGTMEKLMKSKYDFLIIQDDNPKTWIYLKGELRLLKDEDE